jgi:hypothetical protein
VNSTFDSTATSDATILREAHAADEAPLATLAATGVPEVPAPLRTSQVLRGILAQNPGVKAFSVRRILASIGSDRFEASLMMFSIPAIVPVPSRWGAVALPTGAIAYQLASGRKQIELPRAILKKSVSRRALAVAIHAILPILEAAEKVVRPRWAWVSHSSSRRAIGVFVFLLALAIAFPLFGFSPLHATSIFVMALGMSEQDGLAVLIGVAIGVLSLALLAASGISARALRAKAAKWLRKVGQKLGLTVLARSVKRLGYPRLARMLTLGWSDFLMAWDPERGSSHKTLSRTRIVAGKGTRPERALRVTPSPQCASRAA